MMISLINKENLKQFKFKKEIFLIGSRIDYSVQN